MIGYNLICQFYLNIAKKRERTIIGFCLPNKKMHHLFAHPEFLNTSVQKGLPSSRKSCAGFKYWLSVETSFVCSVGRFHSLSGCIDYGGFSIARVNCVSVTVLTDFGSFKF